MLQPTYSMHLLLALVLTNAAAVFTRAQCSLVLTVATAALFFTLALHSLVLIDAVTGFTLACHSRRCSQCHSLYTCSSIAGAHTGFQPCRWGFATAAGVCNRAAAWTVALYVVCNPLFPAALPPLPPAVCMLFRLSLLASSGSLLAIITAQHHQAFWQKSGNDRAFFWLGA